MYKDNNFKNIYKQRYVAAKKLFRTQKRLMIKLKADRNLRRLNNLFKLDKDKFWHSVNRLHDSK